MALQPLSERLAELLKERPCLQADETPVRQLDPGQGKTHRAYLWAYRSNDLDDGPRIVVRLPNRTCRRAHAPSWRAGKAR